MNKPTEAIANDMTQLTEDARDLMNATADVAGEKVGEARKRLATALERAKVKAVEGAKVADQTIRENPYQAIAIAAGVGAIIGYLAARAGSRNRD